MTTTNTQEDEVRAVLDEFVLFTDNTPESNEPTELSVYLRQCGFDDALDRLEDELQALIAQREQAAEKKLWIARSDVAYLLGMLRELGYPHEALEQTYGHSQITNPEKDNKEE